MSDLVLIVAGAEYSGWTEVEVNLSVEQMAGTFRLALTERWPGSGAARPIRPGQACTVQLAGETVITGYVDAATPSYDAESHTVEVWGRDATADLVDCSAVHEPGEWTNKTLAQMARIVAAPFGVGVSVAADVGDAFRKVKLQEGETAFELLDRLARQRGVVLWSDGLGNLVLGLPEPTRAPVALVRGQNVLAASGEITQRDRCSLYVVKGQSDGSDTLWGPAAAQPSARVTDAGVSRYRPLVVLSESPGGIADYRARAEWERKIRAARGSRGTWTVQGWRMTPGGSVWRPNLRVTMDDDWIGTDTELRTAGVRFVTDDQGTRTEITAVGMDALHRAAEPTADEEDALW